MWNFLSRQSAARLATWGERRGTSAREAASARLAK
jgi:hypothetical protein